MLLLYYATWCMGPILEIGALYRMARNSLGRQFPLVMLYLAVCVVRSGALIAAWHSQSIYTQIFDATLPTALLVQSLAIVEVFWAIVEQYPNFRRIGAAGLTILGSLGAFAAWLTNGHGLAPYPTLREIVLLLQRHSSLAMTFALVGIAVLLPRFPHIPVRESAMRAAMILGIDSGLYLVISAGVLAATPYAGRMPGGIRTLITFLPMLSKVLVGVLWLLWMTPASNFAREAEPFTESDRWELMRIKLRLRRSVSRRYSANAAVAPWPRAR